MIQLRLTSEAFEQDIRPLVTSFFPKEELTVFYDGQAAEEGFRYLLTGEWGEDGFLLCLYRGADTEKAVQSEQKALPLAERKRYRDEVKRAVYRMLSAETGRTLPWGTLTGVRPVKQVLERLMAGEPPESVDAFLQKEYYCSKEKRELSLAVATKEKKLLTRLDYENSYSLYLGIPFCPTTCLYCSFTSYPLERFGHLTGDYVKALKREIAASADLLSGKRLATVYFGGGTPTALSTEELREVIAAVKAHFPVEQATEWTVEAGRPDSITPEKLTIRKRES